MNIFRNCPVFAGNLRDEANWRKKISNVSREISREICPQKSGQRPQLFAHFLGRSECTTRSLSSRSERRS